VAEFLGNNNCLRGVVAGSREDVESGLIVDVQVGSHTFTCPSARTLERGTRVLAYLRPENVSVMQDGANGRGNVLDGVVDRIAFDGSIVHLHVDTDVSRLLVEVGGSERLDLMAGAGSKVRLGFDDLTLIPDPA
jgi:ABC-type Fe3+/spermidine/putrescine transport system ATPase subunit